MCVCVYKLHWWRVNSYPAAVAAAAAAAHLASDVQVVASWRGVGGEGEPAGSTLVGLDVASGRLDGDHLLGFNELKVNQI